MGGLVGGSVIHHDDGRDERTDLLNEKANGTGLVQARNNDSDLFEPAHGQGEAKAKTGGRKFLRVREVAEARPIS